MRWDQHLTMGDDLNELFKNKYKFQNRINQWELFKLFKYFYPIIGLKEMHYVVKNSTQKKGSLHIMEYSSRLKQDKVDECIEFKKKTMDHFFSLMILS